MTDHEDFREAVRRTLDERAEEPCPVVDDVGRDVRSGERVPKTPVTPGDFLVRMAGGLPDGVVLAGDLYPGCPTAFAEIPPPEGSA